MIQSLILQGFITNLREYWQNDQRFGLIIRQW